MKGYAFHRSIREFADVECFQCRVVRREARAREFAVVARISLFKDVSVGKPNLTQCLSRHEVISS